MFRATLLAFRVVILFYFSIQSHSYHSEPLSSVLGVQRHVFSLAFKTTIFFSLAFRVVSSFWHSEPLSSLAFGATIFPPFWRLGPFSSALSFRVMAPNIHIHWHCTSCLHDFASVLGFPHLVTLCLSLIHHAILGFLFPCTWHSLLSSRHIFQSCCWAFYT